MLNLLSEDFEIINKYFKRKLQHIFKYINIKKNKSIEKINKIIINKEEKTDILDILLKLNGANDIGGLYIGEKLFDNYPVRIYRLKRNIENNKDALLYIAYILRSQNQYQVVISEDWQSFIVKISDSIKNNQKVNIDIKLKEGGKLNENKRGRYGRKLV